MILIINVCKQKLHYYEFVKPVEDILKEMNVVFLTKNYRDLKKRDILESEGVILCGTSLADNGYLTELEKFSWIKDFEKPLLGICAGMQIIGQVFGCKIGKENEIGFFHERFERDFLGLVDDVQVYHLHNNHVELNSNFDIYSSSKIHQAAKHKEKKIYLTLFHPEVRNKDLIKNFVLLR